MATLKHTRGDHHTLTTSLPQEPVLDETIEARRARRRAALDKIAGIWTNRPDIPADGLEYQRKLRSEWQA